MQQEKHEGMGYTIQQGYYGDRKDRYLKEAEKLFDELYVPKNKDYGDSFDKLLDRLGPVSFVTRAGDKMERLISLTEKKKAEVQDESSLDTIRDLAHYCLMYLMWHNERR